MRRLLVGGLAAAAVLAVYLLRIDDVAGLYKDDAYYMVLAKALAQGDGFTLISSAAKPILPAFPPGFPLVLAPVFAVAPGYPDNQLWLKLISVAAMLGAGALTFRYFARYRDVAPARAATVALMVVLSPGFVFLATSTVMAECVFTFAVLASALAIERSARAEQSACRRRVMWAALITTAAWLVRSAGIAVVCAGAVFLISKQRRQAAAEFVVACLIAYSPWAIYSFTHQSTAEERAAHGGDIVYSYSELLQSRTGGEVTREAVTYGDLISRVLKNVNNVFAHDLGALIFPSGYRGPAESGLEVFMLSGETGFAAGSMGLGTGVVVISMVFTALAIVGGFAMARRSVGVAELICAITIPIVLLLPARTFRYVLPLTPFLIGYFLTGLETAVERLRAGSGLSAVRVVATSALFFFAVEHGQYLFHKFNGPEPTWIRDGADVRAVTDFMKVHTPGSGQIVSTNPALLYLETGRKGVAYVDPFRNWERWRSDGFRCVVALHAVPRPTARLGYQVLFEPTPQRLWVLGFTSGPC